MRAREFSNPSYSDLSVYLTRTNGSMLLSPSVDQCIERATESIKCRRLLIIPIRLC
jgi:hypothetical protein